MSRVVDNEMEDKLNLTRKFYKNSTRFRDQVANQRLNQENDRIFNRLIKIACHDSKSSVPSTINPVKMLHADKRKQEAQKIDNENIKMFTALKNVQPTIKRKDWTQHYQHTRKFIPNLLS